MPLREPPEEKRQRAKVRAIATSLLLPAVLKLEVAPSKGRQVVKSLLPATSTLMI
jgi:hypothetical protein